MRLSRLKLAQIELELTEKDRQILTILCALSFMRTDQIKRLLFNPNTEVDVPRAYATATTRALNRLSGCGLIVSLPRKVGGVKKGSQGKIWYLTEAGQRLLVLGKDASRKKVNPPSSVFLRHTIAVAECYVQFDNICRRNALTSNEPGKADNASVDKPEGLELINIAVEPSCWREYEKNGKKMSLRPDLYAVTASGEYKDSWFIEVDLATEAVQDIVRKCKRYREYYKSGTEQKLTNVFPVVLFIVPTVTRKEKLKEAASGERRPNEPKLFLFIVPDELEDVLKNGAEVEKMC